MTWNHRVVRTVYEHETLLGIHEVFYEDGIPNMVTVNPVDVMGETLEELMQTLEWMLKALGQPILESSDFEEGGKYYNPDDWVDAEEVFERLGHGNAEEDNE